MVVKKDNFLILWDNNYMISLTDLEQQVRKWIINQVKTGDYEKTIIRYSTLANEFKIPIDTSYERNNLFKILDDINRFKVGKNRPLLSVVVVTEEGLPGPGFYHLAKDLGKLKPGGDKDSFAIKARKELFEFWKHNED